MGWSLEEERTRKDYEMIWRRLEKREERESEWRNKKRRKKKKLEEGEKERKQEKEGGKEVVMNIKTHARTTSPHPVSFPLPAALSHTPHTPKELLWTAG